MKAISIKQPIAYYIALGRKPIEIRSWATSYRGPLLICSAQRPYDGNIVVEQGGRAGTVPASFQMGMSTHFKISNEGQLGCALCVVDLVDCRLMQNTIAEQLAAKVEYRVGHFAWEFENVRKIETPFKVKGRLGLFDVDDHLIPDYILKTLERKDRPFGPVYICECGEVISEEEWEMFNGHCEECHAQLPPG